MTKFDMATRGGEERVLGGQPHPIQRGSTQVKPLGVGGAQNFWGTHGVKPP